MAHLVNYGANDYTTGLEGESFETTKNWLTLPHQTTPH